MIEEITVNHKTYRLVYYGQFPRTPERPEWLVYWAEFHSVNATIPSPTPRTRPSFPYTLAYHELRLWFTEEFGPEIAEVRLARIGPGEFAIWKANYDKGCWEII